MAQGENGRGSVTISGRRLGKTFFYSKLLTHAITLKRLYVKCPNCNLIFPSGFQAESVTQLIGFYYLCLKCGRIVQCSPPDYLERIEGKFKKAMKKEEIFALPQGNRIEIIGPDVYSFSKEVIVKSGAFLSSDRAIINYNEQSE